MKRIIILSLLALTTISYGQSSYYKLSTDSTDAIYNEEDFNLQFKSMVKALPKDYSLTPIVYHKYQTNDSIINYVTFKKIWWGDQKIDQRNFEIVYEQDSLFLNLHKKLPEFNLVDLEGKPFNSSQLIGKPTLINFWSTGCSGCIAEMPQLDKLREKYGDRVNFIAISLDPRGNVISFLQKKPFGYFHLVSGFKYADALKISAIPRNLFLDKNGYIQEIKGLLRPIIKTSGTSTMSVNFEFDKILEKLTKL